jgi:hypothetical protein
MRGWWSDWVGIKIKVEAKTNVKGYGQESPFHTVVFHSRQTADSSPGFRPVRNDKELGRFLRIVLVQEVLPVERIALRGAEAGVPDDAAQLFFGRAIRHACGSYYIFFEHH